MLVHLTEKKVRVGRCTIVPVFSYITRL